MFKCGFVSVAILPSVFARSVLLIRHETPTKFISILEQIKTSSLLETTTKVPFVHVSRGESHLPNTLLKSVFPIALVYASIAVPVAMSEKNDAAVKEGEMAHEESAELGGHHNDISHTSHRAPQ